jgi:uncharacterized protein (DUF488 family)
MTQVFTIGFTKTTAENFFSRLTSAGVCRIADVRLHNVSQLAGFAKKTDLKYFAKAICGIDYTHLPCLAPEKEMLDEYKNKTHDWSAYELRFISLMKQRQIEKAVTREELDGACLLCSEDKPHHCHRRLVAEYLRNAWGDVEMIHL